MHPLIAKVHKACMPEMAEVPAFGSGDMLRLHLKTQEKGKERIQKFEGSVIRIQGQKEHIRTVTLLKTAATTQIKRIFPMPSPTLVKVEVLRKAKVRRAYLSYLQQPKGHKSKKIRYKL